MPRLKLSYRQIIDATVQTNFEKNVSRLSYQEYKMKAQAYDVEGNIHTFNALKEKDGRANSLHYKSGFVIGGLIDKLKNKIPYLKDVSGQEILFETYKFEVIETDITNELLHTVAIHYSTDWLTLHQIIGETLLLSKENNGSFNSHQTFDTFLLTMQPHLSIINYQESPVLNKMEF